MYTRRKRGGRFSLSDEKIREFISSGISANSYEKNPKYFRDIVEFIFTNSQLTKYSQEKGDSSVYGIVYKLTLNKGIKSPFVKLILSEDIPIHGNYGKTRCSTNTFFRNKCFVEIRTFLVKLSFLSILEEIYISEEKSSVIMKKFIEEAKMQNKCYDLTYNLGEAFVPACISQVYYDLFMSKGGFNPILRLLLSPEVDTDEYLQKLLNNAIIRKIGQFGIILMEFAEGFQTLGSILDDRHLPEVSKQHALYLSKMAHLKLYEKGFIQGDCHMNNVLVNLDYRGFLPETNGKALVIDFGKANQFSSVDNDISEDLVTIFNRIVTMTNNHLGIKNPAFNWLKLTNHEIDNHNIRWLFEQYRHGREILLEKIKTSMPVEMVEKNSFLRDFFVKSNIETMEHLRWQNIVKHYEFPSTKVEVAKTTTVKKKHVFRP